MNTKVYAFFDEHGEMFPALYCEECAEKREEAGTAGYTNRGPWTTESLAPSQCDGSETCDDCLERIAW